MKHKPSVSNEQAVIKHLREDPEFAAEYLKAAIEETEDPTVLLLALRRLAEAFGSAEDQVLRTSSGFFGELPASAEGPAPDKKRSSISSTRCGPRVVRM